MTLLTEIRDCSNGAQFRRADLHIHSYGEFGSYDVTDTSMTPEGIVDMAIAENLQVVAITDHNVIGNVRRGLKHAEGKPILVVPGVELSTPQGHLLVYCPTAGDLEIFYGKLTISQDKKACHCTIPQCLKFAEEVGGFGVCAHIEIDAGIEKMHPKFDAFKHDVFKSTNLLGLELSNSANRDWFSHSDSNSDRRNCATIRCAYLEQEEEIELAKVMNSDAHTLNALGKNARGDRRLTRFKMESLTFESLRIAFTDCEARVRLEELIPNSIPHFVGMKIEGGFLKDQIVHFSKNLTCIIGGRGAGKSTMLQSLRIASGNQVESGLVDSEVWPDSITLVYEDEVGQQHTLSRTKLNDVRNLVDASGPVWVGIESYGQGETAETIQHCDRDPSILLRFLDEFIDLEDLPEEDEKARNDLLENQTEIEKLHMEVSRIPDIEKAKQTADQQLEALKKQNAGKVVELEQKLAAGRRFRKQLDEKVATLLTSIKESLSVDSLTELIGELDSSNLAVGKEQCDSVKALMEGLSKKITEIAGNLSQHVQDYATKITTLLKEWTAKEQEIQNSIEDIRRNLEKQNIKLDMAFIRKVTKDSNDYAIKLQDLKKLVPKKSDAYARRNQLVGERRRIRGRILAIRQAYAVLMNKNLASTVVDYRVTIKYHEGVLSPALEEIIKNAMEWRTAQVPRAALIASSITPLSLLDAISKKDTKPLEAIKDSNGAKVFSHGEASRILEVLSQWAPCTAIQRCEFEDLPEIKIMKPITRPDGTKTYPVKDFSQLSLGQQQSVLLSIMLFSKSTSPLIIDQPEDNLDSEFIYKTLVRSLRSIKEHRQVIIVTHNANIAVLGDAELIIPLRGASEFSVIKDRGSIDTQKTKDIVCTILEGSSRAFKRRRDMYGF